MSANESDASNNAAETRSSTAGEDSAEPHLGSELQGGISSEERLQADKNTARQRRSKLRGVASKFGLTDEEVRGLAAAGLMMPDVFQALMIDDIGRRVGAVEEDARMRVQYTNLMVPPRDIDAYISGDATIRIDSKHYLKTEKSMAELMVVVRGSAKMLDGIGVLYAEQHAFHRAMVRALIERQQVARVMRNAPPKYLVDFARLLESLGCDRTHLRSADGSFVRMVREYLGITDEDAGRSSDADADRVQAWFAEEDALAESEAVEQGDEDEFVRLSKLAAKALYAGDLETARATFADLEAYEASLEDEFGSAGSGQAADDNTDEDMVEASPVGGLAETGDVATAGANKAEGSGPAGADADGDIAGRAGTAEGGGGVSPADVSQDDSGSADGQKGPTAESPASSGTDAVPSPTVTAIPPEPKVEVQPEAKPSATPSRHKPTGVHQTGWAVTAPVDVEHSRVTGVGRLPGADAFGGIASLAALTPDVVPMWDRVDRQASTGDRLTLADWYRFEVPFGPYALVHMPKKLAEYVPVRDEMFPPYISLDRYGTAAGFSERDMLSLKVDAMGRGSMETAKIAISAVLDMTYGKHDEDLVRFWLFLLIGRRFQDRIDRLFPEGYFHGVIAPDPAAADAGVGFFRIVRVLDDGDLGDSIHPVEFAPFDKMGVSA